LDFGGRVAGAIKLAIRATATETKQAALFVGFPPNLPLADNDPVTILIEDGEYVSDTFFGIMVGPNKATLTMCGGEVHGGNDSGPGYAGVGLIYGGEFNMAGGHIIGADTNEGFEHFGAGLMLYPDAALGTFPTATITGGTIMGGSFLGEDGNYYYMSMYAGNKTTVHLAGGKLSGDLAVDSDATVVVYGEKHLSYEEVLSDGITYGFLNGKLCDGSELGNITVYGGGHVELKGCSDAPKIEECGKKAKSGKDAAFN
jgi:hypothetical protein